MLNLNLNMLLREEQFYESSESSVYSREREYILHFSEPHRDFGQYVGEVFV